MNKMRRSLWIIIALLVFLGIGHLYYRLTGDFRTSYLLVVPQPSLEVKLPELTHNLRQDVSKILTQKFYFFGHGHQIYAFVSEDLQYILKLFKKDYLQKKVVAHFIPPIPPFRKFLLYQGEMKDFRLKRLVNGYGIAYASNRENTGLIYVHFNEKERLNVKVSIVDGLGFTRELDLNNFVYAIQEKVTTTGEMLTKLLSEDDIEGAIHRIKQLFRLYHSDYSKGLRDDDYNLFDNTGFIGDRAIRHDVGKVIRDPAMQDPKMIRKDLNKIVKKRLERWIRKKFPQHSTRMSQEMEDLLILDFRFFSY